LRPARPLFPARNMFVRIVPTLLQKRPGTRHRWGMPRKTRVPHAAAATHHRANRTRQTAGRTRTCHEEWAAKPPPSPATGLAERPCCFGAAPTHSLGSAMALAADRSGHRASPCRVQPPQRDRARPAKAPGPHVGNVRRGGLAGHEVFRRPGKNLANDALPAPAAEARGPGGGPGDCLGASGWRQAARGPWFDGSPRRAGVRNCAGSL
jgi:hypothetical protein